jgi:hypothetical protein
MGSLFGWASALWIAVLTGAVLGYWGGYLIPPTTTVGGMAGALLNYAAIALGFVLAGLTLILTLPNTQFVDLLWNTKPKKKKHDAYSELIFVFSWTALVHWILVCMSVVLVLLVDPQRPAFTIQRHRLRSGIVAGLSTYAFLEFLVTLITLAQVGATYVKHLRDEDEKKKAKALADTAAPSQAIQ